MKQIFTIFLVVAFGVLGWGQTYEVDFEGAGETKLAYASGTVTLSGQDWNMTEALIGTSTADWKNGARSARLRGYGTSSMTMSQDKTGGIGSISFQYRRYGSDSQVDWRVEYSTNGGFSWTQVGSDFTAPANNNIQTFSENVNVSGNARIRIKRATESGSSNRRLNIDDIVITDFGAATAVLSAIPSALSGLDYQEGNGPSTGQSFSLSGTNLDGSNVTLTVPANFEISQSAMGSYSASLTLNSYDGTATDIYVRLASGLSAGSYSGNIDVSGGGASPISVSVEGTVTAAFSIPYFNGLRTTPDFDLAESQGFVFDKSSFTTAAGGYIRIDFDGSIVTPIIDFTAITEGGLAVMMDLTTFGGSSGQELSVEVSSNGGSTYSLVETHSVPGSYQTFTTNIDLSGPFNAVNGRIRFRMTGGTNSTRFRDLDMSPTSFFPITLSSFTARPTGSSVQLDWRTATELNNDYMEVEHSTDGRNYRKIGTVKGAGTTQEEQAYSFLHEAPAAGLNYYRLLQVDYDGAYEYHGPVSVRMSGGDKLGGALSLFPTVASEAVQVQYEGQLSNEAELQVIGMDGRVWRTQRWEVKSASLALPVQDLPAGMYLLRLQVGRDVEVARFVKQ